jgi:hypothetical protein
MTEVYYCVIGIEMGMTCASKIELLGTFTKVEEAKSFITHKVRGNQYSIVDILETFIDKQNLNLQNSIHLN